MVTDKFGFKVFVKDGPCTRHGTLSIVIPYMILWEWQLLSFFHKNLSYRACAEKAYDWRIKFQISTWPAGERGSMIYWTYPKLPLKDVLSLSSLQITLHATFWTDSMTVIRHIVNESKRFHTYVDNRIAVREESNPSHLSLSQYIMTASPIPLMKFHHELLQTRSSAMAFG